MTSNVENTAVELSTTANDILKQMSEAFPEVAGKTFEMYAQYTYTSGIADAVIGVICLFMAILSVFGIIYAIKEDGETIGAVSICLFCVMLIITLATLPVGIIKITSPDGYTVKEIIETISR